MKKVSDNPAFNALTGERLRARISTEINRHRLAIIELETEYKNSYKQDRPVLTKKIFGGSAVD